MPDIECDPDGELGDEFYTIEPGGAVQKDPVGTANAAAAASPVGDLDLLASMIDAARTPATEPATDRMLKTMLPSLWSMFADKDRIYPRLRYWYTLRQVIDVWEVSVFRDVDHTEAGVQDDYADQMKNLQVLRANCDAEIKSLETKALGSRSAQIAQMRHGAVPARSFLELGRLGGLGGYR